MLVRLPTLPAWRPARAGKPLADLGARVAEAEEAERRARLALAVMELALEQASYGVLHAVSGASIISGHLAPALAETLAAVRKAAPKLAGHDVTAAETFLRASEPVRSAYNAVLDASTRYPGAEDRPAGRIGACGRPEAGQGRLVRGVPHPGRRAPARAPGRSHAVARCAARGRRLGALTERAGCGRRGLLRGGS